MSQFNILEEIWTTPLRTTVVTPVGPVATIGEYFTALMLLLWQDGEGFSTKRPFGNSDWETEVHLALMKGGFISGEVCDDGRIEDEWKANRLIMDAIKWNMGAEQ